MIGLVLMMSLSELYSLIEKVRVGALISGRKNLWSLDCEKLIHELYVAQMLVSCLFCRKL